MPKAHVVCFRRNGTTAIQRSRVRGTERLKLFEAVDIENPTGYPDATPQNRDLRTGDGVGTEKIQAAENSPAAHVKTGWGMSRNVKPLTKELGHASTIPETDIYMFGFSRARSTFRLP